MPSGSDVCDRWLIWIYKKVAKSSEKPSKLQVLFRVVTYRHPQAEPNFNW